MLVLLAVSGGVRGAGAQDVNAVALGDAIAGLGVTSRVMLIGAHPDDEDTNLIAWLSRARHVSTAYLSLTRGDGGQNIIGDELGEALGVLRTEELLAARRVDGALQYFTRAYDFGFSKDTGDTFAHWPRDTILGDVIRVVRAFRPHVIVGVFSGTPRDGHGQHQVSGILARAAYDLAGDTVRFPIAQFGPAWEVPKFYRAARGNAQSGTLGMNVGEYSRLRGESYGEIAGRSRSQHKSQGFGALERKGPIMNYLRRESTRVNDATPAPSERSLFDGIDTTWRRFSSRMASAPTARAALDSLPEAFVAARSAFDPFHPQQSLSPLLRVRRLLHAVCRPGYVDLCTAQREVPATSQMPQHNRFVVRDADLDATINTALRRIEDAIRMVSGVTIEAEATEEWALRQHHDVFVTVYNRGTDTVLIGDGVVIGEADVGVTTGARSIAPGGVLRDTLVGAQTLPTRPYWLIGSMARVGGMFTAPARALPDNFQQLEPAVAYAVTLASSREPMVIQERIVFRYADPVKGEVVRPVAIVPAVTLTIAQPLLFARADTGVDRTIDVRVRSSASEPFDVRVSLIAQGGFTVDSATRLVRLVPNQEHVVAFRIRAGRRARTATLRAVAEYGEERSRAGFQLIDYSHIRPQRLYRNAEVTIKTVDVVVPEALRVVYIRGVSDNVAPILSQLGVRVTEISAADIGRVSLADYTTVVIGPRAYEASPELATSNAKLLDFVRAGGTLVVQYGQYEMTQPGIMPYPVTINRPHDRVTHEDAPVTLVERGARVLNAPNRITAADFEGWVQERALYMPRTFDDRYRAVLAMSDPGEAPNHGAILVAPVGRGTYVYTTLALFRQIPAGVPGAARLMVNLLSAGFGATP